MTNPQNQPGQNKQENERDQATPRQGDNQSGPVGPGQTPTRADPPNQDKGVNTTKK